MNIDMKCKKKIHSSNYYLFLKIIKTLLIDIFYLPIMIFYMVYVNPFK